MEAFLAVHSEMALSSFQLHVLKEYLMGGDLKHVGGNWAHTHNSDLFS
jgi:hypothetical protein